MAEYRVEVTRSADRDLDHLNPRMGRRVLTAIRALASEPRPRQCKKLTGSESSYRVRIGAYRVLYQVSDEDRIVTIYAIGHRREIYR
ncbi:MAG: type II toxin-antitoxin system RelE/ParE family toxin [Chloroflexi bacterium]|nr:type II toxin-antitoxin system RelE/ParE family toxin [Chloroflexota bacterium]